MIRGNKSDLFLALCKENVTNDLSVSIWGQLKSLFHCHKISMTTTRDLNDKRLMLFKCFYSTASAIIRLSLVWCVTILFLNEYLRNKDRR